MGKSPMEAALRGLARGGVHDRVDDRLAGGGVHPRAVHGRHRRPADARVRGDHRGGDPGVGRRLADADADAVQPLPEAAARDLARAPVPWPPSACSIACSPATPGRCGRRCASARWRWRSRSALVVGTVCAFSKVPTGFIPSEDTGQIQAQTEGVQGIGFEAMRRHQHEAAADRGRRSERRARVVGHDPGRQPGPACSSSSSRARSGR